MPIISATDNKNHRWKRNANKLNKQTKKNKDQKEQGGQKL